MHLLFSRLHSARMFSVGGAVRGGKFETEQEQKCPLTCSMNAGAYSRHSPLAPPLAAPAPPTLPPYCTFTLLPCPCLLLRNAQDNRISWFQLRRCAPRKRRISASRGN